MFASIALVYTALAARDDVTVSNTVKVILLLLPSNVQFLGTVTAVPDALIAYLLIFLAVGNSYVNVPVLATLDCHSVPVF